MKITNALLGKMLLLAAVLVMLTLGVFCVARGPQSGFVPGAPLVQGLDEAQIAKIVVREKAKNGTGYQTATLLRKGDAFTVEEKNHYPASLTEINELLRTVADIRTSARLAASPAANPEFGVTADKPATGDIAFFDKNGKEFLRVTVGAVNGKGHNVTAGREVYRSEALIEFGGSPLSFIDQSVLKVDSKKVKSVAVARADGGKFSFIGKDGVLKIANPPAGKEENDNETWGMKDGFTRISFDDVAPFSADAKLPKVLEATVTTEEGTVYHLALYKDSAGAYKITADADEPRRDQLTPEKLIVWENAVRFNRAHKGWLFSLSQWEGERIDKPVAKLFKDVKKPEPAKDAKTPEKKAEKKDAQPAPQPAAGKTGK